MSVETIDVITVKLINEKQYNQSFLKRPHKLSCLVFAITLPLDTGLTPIGCALVGGEKLLRH